MNNYFNYLSCYSDIKYDGQNNINLRDTVIGIEDMVFKNNFNYEGLDIIGE
jgi:hypothetical protein